MDDELNIKIMDKETEKGKIKYPYNIEKINIIRDENEKKFF